jgi:hypothetical protein
VLQCLQIATEGLSSTVSVTTQPSFAGSAATDERDNSGQQLGAVKPFVAIPMVGVDRVRPAAFNGDRFIPLPGWVGFGLTARAEEPAASTPDDGAANVQRRCPLDYWLRPRNRMPGASPVSAIARQL